MDVCFFIMGYDLIEPMSMPFTKYFCRKGYTSMIGRTDTIMTDIWTPLGDTFDNSSIKPPASAMELFITIS